MTLCCNISNVTFYHKHLKKNIEIGQLWVPPTNHILVLTS